MSKITIGQLPALQRDVANTDLLAIDDGTTTYKVSVGDFEETAASAAAGYAAAAADSAEEAKGYKNTAQAAVADVDTKMEAAQGYANSASGYATNAYNYADAASASATSAAGYANNASTSAAEASGFASAASGKASDASNEAAKAKSWADYPNASGEYGDATHNAHYYADIAAAIAGGGVISFNGRGGAVVPVDGDYSAGMVPYDNTSSGLTATKTQAAIDEVQGEVGTIQGQITQINSSLADKEKKHTVLSQTLSAGSTTVTFTSIPTSGNYIIEFSTSTGVNYTAIDTSTSGQVTLTFAAQSAAMTVYCDIKEVA